MAEPPVPAYPDYSKPFVLYTDAFDVGIGAVLLQKQADKLRIIRCLSRTLAPAERNYSSPKRECLAIVHSVNLLKPYVLGTNFTVMTDCKVLLTFKENANFKSRLMRWHWLCNKLPLVSSTEKGRRIWKTFSLESICQIWRASPSNIPWNQILMLVDQDSFQLPWQRNKKEKPKSFIEFYSWFFRIQMLSKLCHLIR